MNNQIRIIITVLACLLSSHTLWAYDRPSAGSGTPSDPFQLVTESNLRWFGEYVNASTSNAGTCVIMMNDINASSSMWSPFADGYHGYSLNGPHYTGTFDGNNKALIGINLEKGASDQNMPCFCEYNGGVIKNLIYKDFLIGPVVSYFDFYVYSLIADSNMRTGIIENCTIEQGTITPRPPMMLSMVNGNDGIIRNCKSYFTRWKASSAAAFTIQNGRNGLIENCINYGTILDSSAGGIACTNMGRIRGCINYGELSGNAMRMGGIVATQGGGTIETCINHGNISAQESDPQASSAGGIAGRVTNSSTIQDCVNTGAISCYEYAGGITGGMDYGNIYDCFSSGNVTSAFSNPKHVGAIVGWTYTSTKAYNCHYSNAVVLTANGVKVTTTGEGVGWDSGSVYYSQYPSDIKSGKTARLINGGNNSTQKADGVMGQALPGEATPSPMLPDKSNAVYRVDAGGEIFYGNDKQALQLPKVQYNGTLILKNNFTDSRGSYTGTYTINRDYGDATLTPGQYDMESRKTDIGSATYYQIADGNELGWFSYYVNSNVDNAGINATITKDIDLLKDGICNPATNKSWISIANLDSGYGEAKYYGTIKGNNHTISGLYIGDQTRLDLAFVGWSKGIIENLTIDAKVVLPLSSCCIVAFENHGTIDNCTSKGEVISSSGSGGISVSNYGTIENCTNYATLKSYDQQPSSPDNGRGGIAAYNMNQSASIYNCINNGIISGESISLGGIVAYNSGTVGRSTNNGAITQTQRSNEPVCYIGGIVGNNLYVAENKCFVSKCLNTGNIIGSQYAGGIIGTQHSIGISHGCLNIGNVSTTHATAKVGAILGYNFSGATVLNMHYSTSVVLKENGSIVPTVGLGEGIDDEVSLRSYIAQTPEVLASGKVARLLNANDGRTEAAYGYWGQILATDANPTFMNSDNTNAVYGATLYSETHPMGTASYANATIDRMGNEFAVITEPLIPTSTGKAPTTGINVVATVDGKQIARHARITYTPARYKMYDYDGLSIPFDGRMYIDLEQNGKKPLESQDISLVEFNPSSLSNSDNGIVIKRIYDFSENPIKKGIPYIISFDENLEPAVSGDMSITIEGENTEFSTEVKAVSTSFFTVTPVLFGGIESNYQINDTGTGFMRNGARSSVGANRIKLDSPSSSATVNWVRDIATNIDTTDKDALKIYAVKSNLIIEAPQAVTLPVYSSSSMLVRVIQAPAGRTVVTELPAGFYIIANKKVIIQ